MEHIEDIAYQIDEQMFRLQTWQEDRHCQHLGASMLRVEELDEVVVSMANDFKDTVGDFGI